MELPKNETWLDSIPSNEEVTEVIINELCTNNTFYLDLEEPNDLVSDKTAYLTAKTE